MNRIVFGTLRQRWLRTALVGLSTLVAFMLLGFFLAIRHGFAVGPVQVGADLLLVQPAGGVSALPIGLLATVRAMPGVRAAAGIDGTGMLYGTHAAPLALEGVSAKSFLAVSGLVRKKALPPAQAREWLADRTGALVSAAAAHKNGWRLGETVVLRPMPGVAEHDLSVRVEGVIAKRNGVNFAGDVNVHLGYYRRWAQTQTLQALFLQATHARQADALARDIRRTFANSATPVSTQSFKALLQGIAERLANVNALTAVIIMASLFGLFLICFNTVIHSVTERVGEFALLKAVGFAPARLVWLVFLEAFLAIVPAAAAGMLCAWLVVRAVAAEKLDLPGITLTPDAVAFGGLVALGLAVLSALLPGVRVVRVNCGQVLRKG